MDEDAAKNLSLAWVKQIMDSMASEFGCWVELVFYSSYWSLDYNLHDIERVPG
jgi:hypothetical protein